MDSVLVAFMMILTTFLFGFIYSTMFEPDEVGFTGSSIDPWSFSFTTMSTVGYGGFRPRTDRAKKMVMFQQSLLIIQASVFMTSIAKKMY